jgi:hypothetical protein
MCVSVDHLREAFRWMVEALYCRGNEFTTTMQLAAKRTVMYANKAETASADMAAAWTMKIIPTLVPKSKLSESPADVELSMCRWRHASAGLV